MRPSGNTFPAKIMLFGEYSILLGSSALGIPFSRFTGSLRLSEVRKYQTLGKAIASNRHLREFHRFLEGDHAFFSQILDLEKFRDDLSGGMFFESNIPAGYGLGSSGALVAAIYSRYAADPPGQAALDDPLNRVRLKTELSRMEAYFHGKSSGFDPFVCYLQQPVLMKNDGIPEICTLPPSFSAGSSGMFLLDTGVTGKTAPLVEFFMQNYMPGGEVTDKGRELTCLVNRLIAAFLDFHEDPFMETMRRLSIAQSEEFVPMIPEKILPLWKDGIRNDLFYLKLCGSGGGGYMIGFAPDIKEAGSFISDKGFDLEYLELVSGS